MSVFCLNEALKKLRKVAATLDPEGYNQMPLLRRWYKNLSLDLSNFKELCGTERAHMSTSAGHELCHSYAASQEGLGMSFAGRGLSRGVTFGGIRLFATKCDFWYPPLAMTITGRRVVDEEGVTIVPIILQIS